MRRIKNWLRISQDRFIDLSIINIERSFPNHLSADGILNEFVKQYHRLQL